MMMLNLHSAALLIPLTLAVAGCGSPASVSYSNAVAPVLKKHCAECHLAGGNGDQASGFLVTSYANVMKGTALGPVVVPGDPLSSSLYRLVAGKVDQSIQMPHTKDPMSEQEIALIETWIAQGAQDN
jgi:hypothetical protein